MVGLGGLEPPTSPLSGVRSNQLSYKPTSRLLFTLLCVAFFARSVTYLMYAPSLTQGSALIRAKINSSCHLIHWFGNNSVTLSQHFNQVIRVNACQNQAIV